MKQKQKRLQFNGQEEFCSSDLCLVPWTLTCIRGLWEMKVRNVDRTVGLCQDESHDSDQQLCVSIVLVTKSTNVEIVSS